MIMAPAPLASRGVPREGRCADESAPNQMDAVLDRRDEALAGVLGIQKSAVDHARIGDAGHFGDLSASGSDRFFKWRVSEVELVGVSWHT